LRVGNADQFEGAKRVHVFRQGHADAVASQNIGELYDSRLHEFLPLPRGRLMQMIFVVAGSGTPGLFFRQVTFQFLMRLADIGFIFH
jgi:hypothetical protein